MKTSLELSEKFKKAGFDKESEYTHQKWTQDNWKLSHYSEFNGIDKQGNIAIDGFDVIKNIVDDTDDACFSYDILNDLCVKYFREVFVGENWKISCFTKEILLMLQCSMPQKEIEDFIVANSILFK